MTNKENLGTIETLAVDLEKKAITVKYEPSEKELLEKAFEEANALPVPETKEKVKPWLHSTAYFNKGLNANSFPMGKGKKSPNLPKMDASGEVIKLPNGGAVLVKDYSNIKFWHEGNLISKAEHDELTNGVK